jgi:6-pyruvoyltetrahydropterin/6-carboxytetrahydropterin synthase
MTRHARDLRPEPGGHGGWVVIVRSPGPGPRSPAVLRYTPRWLGHTVGRYRIAKQLEIETGHRLSKHREKCRFPHGHTRTIEVVLTAMQLDAGDMVCDYKALKTVVEGVLERFDHAMILAADDPLRDSFAAFQERLVLLTEGDPTTEVLARHLYEKIRDAFRPGAEVTSSGGTVYRVPDGVRVERVRVWETATTWAEYGED